MKQSKTKYIHSLLPFLTHPSILIPLPMHNRHPHHRQCKQIIASRVSYPPHRCHHTNRQSRYNDGEAQSGVHPAATATQMDNNKTQSVIRVVTTLPADDDKTQSVVRPIHCCHHVNRWSQHNNGKAQSGIHPAATAAWIDNDKTQSVIRPVATVSPANSQLLSHFHQAAASTTKLAAATVLFPPPPLTPRSHDRTSTAYKIKNIEYYWLTFFSPWWYWQHAAMMAEPWDNNDSNVVICNYLQQRWCFNLMKMIVAAWSHIEDMNKMTEHTDAQKILILQLLLK